MDLASRIKTCNRCRYQWLPRGKRKPKLCPACKSPYWDTERTRTLKRSRIAKRRS